MKYEVVVMDNDYRSIVDIYYEEFVNEDEAKRYAENHSWTGESYHVKKVNDDKGTTLLCDCR